MRSLRKAARLPAMGRPSPTFSPALSNTMELCRPYDGKWSKSMVGYGSEDSHFVVELTYNYGIKHYTKGNDFQVLSSPHRECMCIH